MSAFESMGSRSLRLTGAMLFAGVFALSACSESTGPDQLVDEALNEDVAVIAADGALADLEVMTTPSFVFGTPGPQMVEPMRDRSVTWFDEAGAAMTRYDALLTASGQIEASFSRSATREGWSASVDRSRSLTVTGLLGEETQRTWNGSGSGEVSGSRHVDGKGTRSYEMSYTSEMSDVVRAVDRQAQPWPLSGTITRMVEATRTDAEGVSETRTRTTVLTFNGTQMATLTVDGEVFEVDLGAREGRKPVRKR